MISLIFKNVYINDYYTMLGKTENNPVVKKRVDFVYEDYYHNKKSLEETESWFQQVVVDGLLKKQDKKQNDIELLIGGDLNNQLFASNFNASVYNIPFLGVFSACASFAEGLIISSSLIDKGYIDNSIVVTSSHNLVSEKQFRFPIEYGCIKKKINSFSATGATSAFISNKKSKYKVVSATIGKVIDLNHTDSNDMGSAMAPAAAEVIYDHLNSMNIKSDYYDLILTGDLGVYGLFIMKEYLYSKYKIKINNVMDAGATLYNCKPGDEFAGGSGPICLPLILFNKIFDNSKYKKILIVATGSLHSVVSVNLKKGMPGVAHAIGLEVNNDIR
jgi:stage V sporulation protein AD